MSLEHPTNLQERAAKLFMERADTVAQRMDDKIGTPARVGNVDTQEELEFWWTRNPTVDESELLSQGMPIDQILDQVYPYRRQMYMFGRPEPDQQIEYADRMRRLSAEHGYPKAATISEDSEPE